MLPTNADSLLGDEKRYADEYSSDFQAKYVTGQTELSLNGAFETLKVQASGEVLRFMQNFLKTMKPSNLDDARIVLAFAGLRKLAQYRPSRGDSGDMAYSRLEFPGDVAPKQKDLFEKSRAAITKLSKTLWPSQAFTVVDFLKQVETYKIRGQINEPGISARKKTAMEIVEDQIHVRSQRLAFLKAALPGKSGEPGTGINDLNFNVKMDQLLNRIVEGFHFSVSDVEEVLINKEYVQEYKELVSKMIKIDPKLVPLDLVTMVQYYELLKLGQISSNAEDFLKAISQIESERVVQLSRRLGVEADAKVAELAKSSFDSAIGVQKVRGSKAIQVQTMLPIALGTSSSYKLIKCSRL